MKVSNKNWNDAQIWFKKNAIFYRNVFHARIICSYMRSKTLWYESSTYSRFSRYIQVVRLVCMYKCYNRLQRVWSFLWGFADPCSHRLFNTNDTDHVLYLNKKKPSFLDCIGVSIKSKSEFKTYTLYFYTLVFYFLM